MASPALELQAAIVARLKAQGIAGGRVYDAVPTSAAFPYLSIGPIIETQEDAECIGAVEVSVQVDVWSRAVGSAEAATIAHAVRGALHGYEAALASNALVSLEHRITRRLRDPDGLTTHAVVDFVAIIETP